MYQFTAFYFIWLKNTFLSENNGELQLIVLYSLNDYFSKTRTITEFEKDFQINFQSMFNLCVLCISKMSDFLSLKSQSDVLILALFYFLRDCPFAEHATQCDISISDL